MENPETKAAIALTYVNRPLEVAAELLKVLLPIDSKTGKAALKIASLTVKHFEKTGDGGLVGSLGKGSVIGEES